MIEIVKRWIAFRIKNFEFRIRTWKNSYKISKAYTSDRYGLVSSFRFRTFLKTAIVLIVGIVALTGIAFGITRIVKMNLFKYVNVATSKNSKTSLAQKENIKDPENEQLNKQIENTIVNKILVVDSSLFEYDSTVTPVGNDSNDFMVIIANKARNVLYLLDKNVKGKWLVVRTFYMATGSKTGRKVESGDKKTPEGLYLIVERKEKDELLSIYGPLAYVLDYPNEIDRKEGRTGQGIWIHGTEKDSFPVETKGCLELNNIDLTDLSKLLGSGQGTPVLIVNDSLLKNPVKVLDPVQITLRRKLFFDSFNNVQENFTRFLTDWATAWESRDIKKYSKYYHQSKFTSMGMDWDAWREKKAITFSLYDTIKITYSKLAVSEMTDSSAIVKFAQVYKTEKVEFVNNKQLYLEKEQGTWKITREAAF